jgi:hypothetical protein
MSNVHYPTLGPDEIVDADQQVVAADQQVVAAGQHVANIPVHDQAQIPGILS